MHRTVHDISTLIRDRRRLLAYELESAPSEPLLTATSDLADLITLGLALRSVSEALTPLWLQGEDELSRLHNPKPRFAYAGTRGDRVVLRSPLCTYELDVEHQETFDVQNNLVTLTFDNRKGNQRAIVLPSVRPPTDGQKMDYLLAFGRISPETTYSTVEHALEDSHKRLSLEPMRLSDTRTAYHGRYGLAHEEAYLDSDGNERDAKTVQRIRNTTTLFDVYVVPTRTNEGARIDVSLELPEKRIPLFPGEQRTLLARKH